MKIKINQSMTSINLYKRTGRTYEYEADKLLTHEMKKNGYRTNVWMTLNQLKGEGGYYYGKISMLRGCAVTIRKMDYRTKSWHELKLVNIDQTDFPEKWPEAYRMYVEKYQMLYMSMHKGICRRIKKKIKSITDACIAGVAW